MNLQQSVHSFNKLIRIYGSLISATISGLLAGFNLHDPYNGFLIWLAIFFTITYGFSINDYFDYKKDSVYPEKHVIAAGLLSRSAVGVISFVLAVSSLTVTFFVHPFQQLINLLLLLILTVYSWINNRFGILANVLVAVCSALSIIIAEPKPEWSIFSFSGISVFFFIFSREIIKDIHDVEADSSVGKSSFPIKFSKPAAFNTALVLAFLSILVSVYTSYYFHKLIYLIMFLSGIALYLYYTRRYRRNLTEDYYRDFSKYSKVFFLFIIPALLFSI